MDSYEKKIREYLNSDNVDQSCKSILINLFPELCDSEDEKIRKYLITYFSDIDDCASNLKGKDIVAWLEKQRDQKHEWSEKDENYMNALIDKLETLNFCNDSFSIGGYRVDVIGNWLKSLKDRCVPQKQYGNDVPSREYILNIWELGNLWKEKTKGVCGTEIEYIQEHWKEGDYYEKLVPQKNWKPSEEQIYMLNWITLTLGDGPLAEKAREVISDLLEQLKAL